MNELNAYQIGIVLINFFISVFAEAYELHSFIFKGARLQALTPSLMKVFFERGSYWGLRARPEGIGKH